MTCPRCDGPVGGEPCLDHHPQCDHRDCTCPTVCPRCCSCAHVLHRHEIPMPGGTAVITTSRPGPDAPWTTSIDAPGLDCHQWARTHHDERMATRTHLLSVDVVRGHVAAIPTIDFRRSNR